MGTGGARKEAKSGEKTESTAVRLKRIVEELGSTKLEAPGK